jgi:hypothetical protein
MSVPGWQTKHTLSNLIRVNPCISGSKGIITVFFNIANGNQKPGYSEMLEYKVFLASFLCPASKN